MVVPHSEIHVRELGQTNNTAALPEVKLALCPMFMKGRRGISYPAKLAELDLLDNGATSARLYQSQRAAVTRARLAGAEHPRSLSSTHDEYEEYRER